VKYFIKTRNSRIGLLESTGILTSFSTLSSHVTESFMLSYSNQTDFAFFVIIIINFVHQTNQ